MLKFRYALIITATLTLLTATTSFSASSCTANSQCFAGHQNATSNTNPCGGTPNCNSYYQLMANDQDGNPRYAFCKTSGTSCITGYTSCNGPSTAPSPNC